MQVTFLGADYPLVKTFTLVDGHIEKSPYPNAYLFTSHTVELTELSEFHTHITAAAAKGQCLLKGEIKRPLTKESRAGTTDAEARTQWVCFDLDGLEAYKTPDEFMDAIGCSDVSYVIQYSASMGIDGSTGLRAHLFVMLTSPVAAPFLKQWLTSLNLNIDALRAEIRLSRTGSALRWPLDVTCCQNDKLIYIAPAILGKGVKDSFKGKRIALVKRNLDALPSNRVKADINKNRADQKALLAKLRKDAGYAPIKDKQYKTENGISYLAEPGDAIITGIKQERGFVYFNLNGGDSWAYYHSEDNPNYIYNFKGEPVYKTEELLPEYWKSLEKIPDNAVDGLPTRTYFVFRDFHTDRLYNGWYDKEDNEVEIARAANETRLRSFMKQHGQPVPDFIPDWELRYDPTSDLKYDPENKIINLYRPSEYAKLKKRKVTEMPPTVRKIIESAVGKGPAFDHFVNWVSHIIQTGRMTKTSWALQGNQGTGKGILFHNILKPLLGASNCSYITMDSLEGQFNGWMENTQLVFVDEVQLSKLANNAQVNAKLKSYIVEPVVPVRRMYSDVQTIANFCNFLFASNTPDPVIIEHTDRRNNVGEFQCKRLEITDAEIATLETELPDSYMFFAHYKVDEKKVQTPLENEDRARLMSINRTSVDEVADAILEGDFEFFLDSLPSNDDPIFATPIAAAYRQLLERILVHGEQWKNLAREELFIIYDYCVGGMPDTPNKFTAMLKHHRLYLKKVRRGETLFKGIDVKWKHSAKWFEDMRAKYVTKPAASVTSIKKARVTA